jgi:hypothetical protein
MREIGCARYGLLDVAWFLCASRVTVSFVVVVSASASCIGRQRGLCGSCQIRVTSMHYIKSIRVCLRKT